MAAGVGITDVTSHIILDLRDMAVCATDSIAVTSDADKAVMVDLADVAATTPDLVTEAATITETTPIWLTVAAAPEATTVHSTATEAATALVP